MPSVHTTELPMTQDALAVRVWNDTPISRRNSDGYVNATAMCKANGREWSTYARSERTKEYIAALEAVPQFCRTELVQSIWGGRPELQGTWIHPRLAVDLARWISPAFAVWMDGWFLESIQQQQQPQPRQQLRPAIDPYRVARVLPTCSRLNAAEILPQLGLPNTRANQMALAPVMTRLGYRKHRSMINGRRYWFYVGAVVPRGHVQQELDLPAPRPFMPGEEPWTVGQIVSEFRDTIDTSDFRASLQMLNMATDLSPVAVAIAKEMSGTIQRFQRLVVALEHVA